MHLLDVGARRPPDLLAPLGAERDELVEALAQRVRRRVHDRHADVVRLLGAPDGLVVEERDHGLAQGHALDREEPVPPGVQLIDDDVGVAVVLERLPVVQALDDPELDVELRAGGEHVVGALPTPRGRGVDDDGSLPAGRGDRRDRVQIDAGWDHRRIGHPADRVVAPHDLGTGLLPVRELDRRLAADVRAEVVHHRRLPEHAQERELQRLRDERQAEREVEEVGARDQLREGLPLRCLSTQETAVQVERPVGLGVELVAVEDDERGVDAASAQGLDVRPRHARGVDRAVDDAQWTFRSHARRPVSRPIPAGRSSAVRCGRGGCAREASPARRP